MYKIPAACLFLTLILLACKKDKNEIFYQTYEPALYLHLPEDSIILIDLNQDGTNDLKFKADSWSYCGSSYPNCNHSFKMTVGSLHDDLLIAHDKEKEHYCKKYNSVDKINRRSEYDDLSTLYADVSPSPQNAFSETFTDFMGEAYIGFQWKKHYYGWVKIRCQVGSNHPLEVLGYAYSKNPNKAIRAGE